MNDFVIDVRGLIAKYGEKTVLEGVDFQVRRGEIMVILGGSGCGKSTLLKHIIGLHAPYDGEVLVFGEPIWTEVAIMERVLRRVGVLFQNGALLNSIPVGENVALPLREHTDLPEVVIRRMVQMKLALVGLSHAEYLFPPELSGGMRKRAALARAMALDPEIIFCDEPSAGLDPLTARELDELLLKLKRLFGMTLVVVTHELASIEIIADRITYLDAGKVLATGPLEELRHSGITVIEDFFARRIAEREEGDQSMLSLLTGDSQTW